MDAGVHELDDWDVLAVKDNGLYIRGDEDPWLVVPHKVLMRRYESVPADELARAYVEATGGREDDG